MSMKRLSRSSHSSRSSRESQETQATEATEVSASTTTITTKTQYNYEIFSLVDRDLVIWRKLHRRSVSGQLLDGQGIVLATIHDQSPETMDNDDTGVDRSFRIEVRHPQTDDVMLVIKRPRHLINGETKVYLPGWCSSTNKRKYLELGHCTQSFSYIHRQYQLATLEDRKLLKYHSFGEVSATPRQQRFTVSSATRRYGVGDDVAWVDAAPSGVPLKHSSVLWFDQRLTPDHRVILVATAACLNIDYLDPRNA
ncbi:hypothetical protein DIURU_000204 [Diutina rugosa]|uniref:Uncharacterized protein n=1 Tax=Diutina rugosa TaxID=5481 RepID=A0A642V0X2_DIURU|nr:uncharacterized protein DIURU_000204 [Diutina rugosa]KAA8908415.1 hypothetical protein DIURU_000204 [Diutina rugosa]